MSVRKAPSNSCFLSLTIFARMQSLFHRKAAVVKEFDSPEEPIDTSRDIVEGRMEEAVIISDIGNRCDWDLGLQRSVKMLHFGSWEEKEAAAGEMRWLAAEGGLDRRKSMAGLGVIPPLVAMVGSEVADRRGSAVRALIELANGTFTNKALMVEAGLLSKLPKNIGILEEKDKRELAQLLSSISALANSKFSLDSTTLIPAVLSILERSSSVDTQQSCLSALHNVSSVLDNSGYLISKGIIGKLIDMSSMKEASEKALATLGNLVVTLAGRKAVEQNPMVPERLVEIMTWEYNPKCQELSAYILMVLAHQSSSQRRKMKEVGIVQVLLGVALLGSPLAQKRALKILQWFKDDRQTRVGPHSGPQVGRVMIGSPMNRKDAKEGKVLMKKIVKQSLCKNMETITRRANGVEDPSKLKALVVTSSSKSLPY